MRRHVRSIALSQFLFAFLASVEAAPEESDVEGAVRGSSGSAVAAAEVALLDPERVVLRAVETDASGRFVLNDVPAGRYILLITADHFAPRQMVLDVGAEATSVEVVLSPGLPREEVVVTATPGVVQSKDALSQPVNVIDQDELALRAKSVVAQVAQEEAGLHLQRTSPTMSGIFVRGFTGNKVAVFVDGVRYSTGSARGGVNTFLNLIDPSFLSGVEVLRGPNSAQYGSDAIGGSVQFLTRSPALDGGGERAGGGVTVHAGSADTSGGIAGSGSYSTPTFGIVGTLSTRRVNDLRPGDGVDSHNAVTRYLGLPSSFAIDETLPETSFTQNAAAVKFEWAPSSSGRLLGLYVRGQQENGQRYDQLIGGDGNLVAELRDLTLDFGYLAYRHKIPGWFDELEVRGSINSQREERINQGGSGNPAASVNHEPERTQAFGFQTLLTHLEARHAFSVGGDVYFESVDAQSFGVNPTSGAVTVRRGRVPDGAEYRQGGVFVQDVFEAIPGRLVVNGSLRWGGARYRAEAADSPLVSGQPLWPDDTLTADDITYRAGGVFTITDGVRLRGNVSRGFRAPHVTDLGTLGLTGSGFEVAAPDVEGLGGEIGSTADANAVTTGRPVEQVESETSLTYELGTGIQRGRFEFDLTVFRTDVDDNISKQTLILPQGAVGTTLGDQTITSQNANGAVFVPASPNPVLVRTNYGDARVDGIEYTFAVKLGQSFHVSSVGTYLRAEDRATGAPPNIEGGTPPTEAYVALRWQRPDARWWIEPYVHLARKQTRLSSLDLGDRRTGSGRSASSIASFFNNGARARGMIGAGSDLTPGTADDVLLATGETLAQVQARVLGPGLTANSLWPEIPGYCVAGVRGAYRFGPHEILVDLENLTDENYRGPSWGVDAPGRGIFVRYAAKF